MTKRILRRLIFQAAILVVMLVAVSPVQALLAFHSEWSPRYRNSQTADNAFTVDGRACRLCHEIPGGDSWNGYEWAL